MQRNLLLQAKGPRTEVRGTMKIHVDIFGKAASSDASEPAGGVAMASQFASLQPVT